MLDDLFCDEIVKPSIELIANHHYKNIAAKKLWDMGWSDVHEELEDLPFCKKQGQITKVFKCECYGCRDCEQNGICVLCYEKNGKEFHRLADQKGIKLLNDNSFKVFVHEPQFKIPPPPSDYQLAIDNNWPFCILKKKLAKVIICFEYENCPFTGRCFSCFKEDGVIHTVYFRNPEVMNGIESKPRYKRFTEICSWRGGDWHDWYHNEKKFILFQGTA